MVYDTNQQQNATNVLRKNSTNISDYENLVSEILRKIRRLSDLPPMMLTELDKKTQDWTEVLVLTVPYESLYDCYLKAASQHRDGPFKVGLIIAAYEATSASLPVIQTECMFCPRLMEDPSAPQSCVGDPSLPVTCPFHGQKVEGILKNLTSVKY